jgi:hypothetical protein
VLRLLVIARSTSGFVFGGFTSVGFGHSHGTCKADASAFVFTLINPHGIAPTMLMGNGDGQDVSHYDGNGAIFGEGDDLLFVSNCHTVPTSRSSLGSSYTDTTGKGEKLFTGARQLGTIAEILAFSV